MDIIHTRCPVARVEAVGFVERVSVGGETRAEEFTRQVHWIRESESTILALHGGCVLKTWSTYNDHYGFLRSASPDLLQEAQAWCEQFGVDRGSTLEIVIETVILERPAVEAPDEEEARSTYRTPENGWLVFAAVPSTWFLAESVTETYADGSTSTRHPRLKTEAVAREHVWSSRWGADRTMEAAVESLRIEYTPKKVAG